MKKTTIICFLTLLVGCQSNRLNAFIKSGQSMDEISDRMSDSGYQETGLDMGTRSSQTQHKMWPVGEGVLILEYSAQTKLVTKMSYFLCDERPKATRQEFEFAVSEFNPVTREMRVALRNVSNAGDGK